MNKLAKSNIDTEVMGDIMTSSLSGKLSGLSKLVGLVGNERHEGDDSGANALNIVPGVASYRLANRLKTQAVRQDRKHGGKAGDNIIGETFGSPISTGLATMLGAAIGGGYKYHKSKGNEEETAKGALVGGLGGLGLSAAAHIAAMISAAARKRRSEEEQVEHDSKLHVEDYLVPGMSTYNKYKRIGRVKDEEGKKKEGKEKKASYTKPLSVVACTP